MYVKLSGETLCTYSCLYDFMKILDEYDDLFQSTLELFAEMYQQFEDRILNCKTVNDLFDFFDNEMIDIYDPTNIPYGDDFIEYVLMNAKDNYFIDEVSENIYAVIKLTNILVLGKTKFKEIYLKRGE